MRLDEEWIAALDEAARTNPELADVDPPAVVEQRVQTESGEVAYHLVLGPGPARVRPGRAAAPDVTLVTTEAAARRVHAGEANAQRLLAEGSLRLRGNPEVLGRLAPVLTRAGALLGPARR